MREKTKGLVLDALGILFLIWGLGAIFYQISIQEPYFVLWFCYTGLILIGLGILLRSDFLIAAQLALMTMPLIIWSIDFFSFLITGKFLWGITAYLFKDQANIGDLISLQHIFTVPLALFSLWIIKLKRKDFWILSIFEAILFYFFSGFFSTSEQNLNYVFSSSVPFETPLSYAFDWFFFVFLMIFLTSVIFLNLKFLRSDKAKNKQ